MLRFTVLADTVSHFAFRGKWGKDEERRERGAEEGLKYRLVLIHCVKRNRRLRGGPSAGVQNLDVKEKTSNFLENDFQLAFRDAVFE